MPDANCVRHFLLAGYALRLAALSLTGKVTAQRFELFLRHGAVVGELSQQVACGVEQAFADAVGRGLRRLRLRG